MDIGSPKEGIEKQFLDLCTPIVEGEGLKIYDLNYLPGQSILRLFIYDEKSGTAEMEDCVRIDRAMTEPIENESWVPEVLNLEVSSPGVYKSLTQLRHFSMSRGEYISVTLQGNLPEDELNKLPKKFRGSKKFRGVLLEVENESFQMDFEGKAIKFNYEIIKKAQVDPAFEDLNSELK